MRKDFLIYTPYVENSAITFETSTPCFDEFKERIENISVKYPYLIAEDNGIILGYAYVGPFNGRAAYSHCCEFSIYININHRQKGIGRSLYEELENI